MCILRDRLTPNIHSLPGEPEKAPDVSPRILTLQGRYEADIDQHRSSGRSATQRPARTGSQNRLEGLSHCSNWLDTRVRPFSDHDPRV
jgi:hypothetical protein